MSHPRTYWNAEVYERIGTPMRRWAQAVIDDLALDGDETVLDAGCGSGSVTFDLLAKLPRGKIYAVDSSPQMIEKISASIAEWGTTNLIPIHADLTDFTVPEPVDVVFSNAVLHWIPDDDALFSCLLRAAKPRARFRAQCTGPPPSPPPGARPPPSMARPSPPTTSASTSGPLDPDPHGASWRDDVRFADSLLASCYNPPCHAKIHLHRHGPHPRHRLAPG